ncbi:cytochrome P450 78A5-like, partial [Morus notabilis]
MKPSDLNLVNLISLLTVLTWFGLTIILSYQTSWTFGNTFSLSTLFSLLFFSFNHWLIPGGFAWSNYHHHDKKLISIRGPMGWPVLGNLPEMASRLAHRKLAHLASSLDAKRLMALSLGSTRVVISSHPDTAKEILAGSSFSDRPIKESARLLMFERAIGFAPAGFHWRHLRRIAAVHMFSPRSVAGLEGLRQRVADEMLARVGVQMEEKGVVGLRGMLQEGSLTNILESVFGSSSSCRFGELGQMVKEGYELISTFNLEDYFPLGFMDFHGVKRRCHKLAAKVNTVVGQIVEGRKTRESHENNSNNDFLSALLSLPKEDQLSDSDMVAILW